MVAKKPFDVDEADDEVVGHAMKKPFDVDESEDDEVVGHAMKKPFDVDAPAVGDVGLVTRKP
jgi:NADH:ubiquinone oxidoreductase subunit H